MAIHIIVSFKYDPFGRRIYKSSSSGISVFAYDGDNLVEETNAAGAVVARYEQTQKIDEPLAMLRAVARTWEICETRALSEGFQRGVFLREAGNRLESGYATIFAPGLAYELYCPCEGISSGVPRGRARNCRSAQLPLHHLRQCGR